MERRLTNKAESWVDERLHQTDRRPDNAAARKDEDTIHKKQLQQSERAQSVLDVIVQTATTERRERRCNR